jgi:hypothetical protein
LPKGRPRAGFFIGVESAPFKSGRFRQQLALECIFSETSFLVESGYIDRTDLASGGGRERDRNSESFGFGASEASRE